MKTLFLLRHAKSSWEDPSLRDFDRPLAPRGIRAGVAIRDFLRRQEWFPDHALVSAARRTQETWDLVSEGFSHPPQVEILNELYLAAPETILQLIRYQAGEAERVMIVGHNPGIEETALGLVRKGSAEHLARMERKYPTGALTVLTFDSEGWPGVTWRSGDLEAFIRPKDLRK